MQENAEHGAIDASELESTKSLDSITFTVSKKTVRRFVVIGSTLGLLVIVAIAFFAIYKALPPTKFSDAVKTCGETTSSYASLDQSGKGLFLDGAGENGQGLSSSEEVCFLQVLKIPNSILNRMDHTTSLMGSQTASVEDMQLEWSYHPTNGLDISFSIK